MNDSEPLCSGCASAKYFVWDVSQLDKQKQRKFDSPDYIPFNETGSHIAKIKCVFNRMFVPAPAELIECPDFETQEEAVKREKRKRSA